MKIEEFTKRTPPPRFVGRKGFLGAVCALLCVVFAFALVGCGEPASVKTATYQETVDGILWEVTYNIETREIVSVKTPLAMLEFDRHSPFFRFMVEYTSNPDVEVIHSSTLSGKPIKTNVYKIEQVETYKISCSRSDYEKIKETFPSCVYSEAPFSYEVIDHNTGETSTVTGTATEVTFISCMSTYEQKITFTVPAP